MILRRTLAATAIISLLTLSAAVNVGATPLPIVPKPGGSATQTCLLLTKGDVQRWQLGLDETLIGRC